MSRLKNLALVLLAISMAHPAFAGMESAIAAYRDRDFSRAREEFAVLAEAGEPRAQTVLAIMYRYGEGTRTDQQAAYTWYLKAAEQDYAPAQYAVADMLINGEGIPEDRDTGVLWMQRAANAGHDRAIDYLQSSGPLGEEGEQRWSRDWDLRLPNEIRFDPPESAPAFRVQLGESPRVERLQALWRERREQYPEALDRMKPGYLRDLTARAENYELQAGSFATEAEARAVCEAISPSPCSVIYQ